MIIYKAVNKINNKCYIGKTIHSLPSRKTKHIYAAKNKIDDFIFHKAIRKHGKEKFKWKTIKECKSLKEMDSLEIYYINKYNSFYGNYCGYNMIVDGSSGMRGKTQTEEHKIARRKYKHTPEAIEKIRQASIFMHKNNPGFCKGMLGKTHTEKTKEKMSFSAKENTNGSKIWTILIDNKKLIIKNLTKWCKDNNYSYQKAKWRIKNNIDLRKVYN